MQWFKKEVGEAIKTCHQQQCLLIVFVTGKSYYGLITEVLFEST